MTFLDVPTLRWTAALVLMFAGGGFALYGERNLHFVLGLVGLVIGLAVGHVVASLFDAGRYIRIAAMMAGGTAGIFLNIFLFYLNLVIVGSYTGMLTVMIVMNLVMTSWFEQPVMLWEWGLLLLGGVLGGGFALLFRKLLIVLFSALHGTAAVVLGLGMLTYTEEVRRLLEEGVLQLERAPIMVGTMLWAILAVGACMVQYRYTGTMEGGSNRVESYPKRDGAGR